MKAVYFKRFFWRKIGFGIFALMPFLSLAVFAEENLGKAKIFLPALREKAAVAFAPNVPPPIQRKCPAVVEVHLNSGVKKVEIKPGVTYQYWTFNDDVPGPFIRIRVGDTLEVHHTNNDASGMPHNIDFHAVTGPGGGAPVTTTVKGEERVSWFKMLHPGLYVYHCAAPPVMDHIANGMYGLILVEPKQGLAKVDHEFYVMQHEVYGRFKEKPPAEQAADNQEEDDFWSNENTVGEHDHHGQAKQEETGELLFSHQDGLDEHPKYVFFNGKYGKHLGEGKLKAKVGEKVRIFFGNAGPNLISSFHVIGEIFDNVYREGDLVSKPSHSIQTTLVPAGGSTMVEFGLDVPGTYTLVDHAIFRVEKGAVGYLEVEGKPNQQIYVSDQEVVSCQGCLVHP